MSAEVLTTRSLGGLEVVPVKKRSPYLNLLIYGDSGVGKTTLAGSADEVPELRPAIVVDFEGGTESLVRPYPDVEQVRVKNWKDMQRIYDELHRGKTEYATVILDSLTEIQKFNMEQVMKQLLDNKPDADPDVPSMREWGKNLEQMRRFVRGFRDLPMNTIFTALSKVDKDEKTGRSTTLPSLSGKLSGEVAAFLDIVTYYYVKRVGKGEDAVEKRLLLTQKTENIIAKDRTQQLPFIVEDPSMKKLFDYIYGSGKQSSETVTLKESEKVS
jgi:hypothetical protein